MRMKAPHLDQLIERCKTHPVVKGNNIIKPLISLFKTMNNIKVQGDDEYRKIWLKIPRGTIEDYGSWDEAFESGEFTNKEEFEENWLYYYPNSEKWIPFAVTKYQKTYYYYLNSNLVFQFKESQEENESFEFHQELANWLDTFVKDRVNKIVMDVNVYNEDVNNNLPYPLRTGKILRSEYWKMYSFFKDQLDKKITSNDFKVIEKIHKNPEKLFTKKFQKMNAKIFYEVCTTGYDANGYFDKAKQEYTPKEKYKAFADMRDCGLNEIDQNSFEAYEKWFAFESHCGGHPWEICSGGNSTHISLFVRKDEDGWSFRLAGKSRARVLETVKMASAFYANKIPFILSDVDIIYPMITGTSYIGIVPTGVIPVYCHSYFPSEDNINDFMNIDEEAENFIEKAIWYPIEPIELA